MNRTEFVPMSESDIALVENGYLSVNRIKQRENNTYSTA